MNSAEHFRRQFDDIAPQLPGADITWLNQSRRGALEQFTVMGYPSPRIEDWKYARLTPITKQTFQTVSQTPPESAISIPQSLRMDGAYQMVFIDGHFREDISQLSENPSGIRVCTLAMALKEFPQRMQALFGHAQSIDRHGFNALNSAFANDAVIIELDSNQVLDRPLQLIFLSSPELPGQEPFMVHPRVMISLAANSRLQLIESFSGTGAGNYLNNCATLAVLGNGARLDHYKHQQEASGAFHISSLDVLQHVDSQFISHSISLGAAISRNEIHVNLNGPGAECTLNGLYMGSANQYVDYHTRIDHSQPHCNSKEHYKGVLGGSAQGVFNGRVYVHPDAQKSDAQQSNQNLLLSATAEVDTKPQLEIYADDVKCSHGATIGQLDESMVFYMRSRGIPESAARSLLTYGFAREIVDRIDLPQLRECVALALLDGMPDSTRLRSMIQ